MTENYPLKAGDIVLAGPAGIVQVTCTHPENSDVGAIWVRTNGHSKNHDDLGNMFKIDYDIIEEFDWFTEELSGRGSVDVLNVPDPILRILNDWGTYTIIDEDTYLIHIEGDE